MKLRLPRRRVWRAAIYLGSFALVLVAIDLILVETRRSITPGFDTTRIVGPLMPDGSIDYLTAIEDHFGNGVTPQNNAAVLIVQALGRQALPANQPRDGITVRLGLPPIPDQGEYFQKYETYCKAHSVEQEPDPTRRETATTQPTPVGAATVGWIKENEAPLALIAEASKRPRFFMPFNGGTRPTTLIEVLIPHIGPLQDVRRALLTRAAMRLEAGDFAGFHDDVQTVHRLARLLGQGATVIDRLVGHVMETYACRAERLAAASGKLTREQMRTMAAELAAMPDLAPFDESVNAGERYMILDIFQASAQAGPSRPLLLDVTTSAARQSSRWSGWSLVYRFWPLPYEEMMRVMNRFYDGGLAAMRLRGYAQRREALLLWDKEVQKIQKRSFIPKMLSAEWPAQVFLPSLLGEVWGEERGRVERHMAELALVLELFKSEHGAYPDALAELSPAYLSNLPDDTFSDKPFIYSRGGAGYTLYSVGPNMVDDGGKDQRPGDDIMASKP